MEIFKLVGRIMVDSSQAENSLHKTDKQAESLGKKFASGVKTAAKWAAGIVAAAVAVGTAMVAAAKGTASEMDAIDKGSARMGITAERYQELAYAAELCGVSMETMEKAAKKLEGTGFTFDDALYTLMQIPDEAERTQKAIDLFGESLAYELTPLLQSSQEELEGMSDEAHKLGAVMSNDTVKAGAKLNDLFTKVGASAKGLKNGLISDLFPYVEQILNWVLDNMPLIQETISRVMSAILPLITTAMDAVMELLPPLMDAIMAAIDFIMPYVEPVIESLKSLFTGFTALLKGDFEGFWDGIKGFLQNIIPVIKDLGSKIFSGLWDGMKFVWGKMADWINGIVDSITDWFSGIGKSVAAFFGFGGNDADGSHASGLANVPYDGYRAVLHRGETVLNQQDSSKLLAMLNGGGIGGISQPINITVQSVLDGRVIGESTMQYMHRRERAMGI